LLVIIDDRYPFFLVDSTNKAVLAVTNEAVLAVMGKALAIENAKNGQILKDLVKNGLEEFFTKFSSSGEAQSSQQLQLTQVQHSRAAAAATATTPISTATSTAMHCSGPQQPLKKG